MTVQMTTDQLQRQKEKLLNKNSICINCGGIEVDFDYLGQYYFIRYTSNRCVYCNKNKILERKGD